MKKKIRKQLEATIRFHQPNIREDEFKFILRKMKKKYIRDH